MGNYFVVVSGRLLPGFASEQVMPQLAALFGQPPEMLLRLLDGQPKTIKRQIDGVTADRYVARLREIGVDCHSEIETLEIDADAFVSVTTPVASPDEQREFGASGSLGNGVSGISKSSGATPLQDSSPIKPLAGDELLWKAVIQSRAEYYVPKWSRYAAGESTIPGWHWPALFLGFCWAIYRKAWVGALIMLGSAIGIQMLGGLTVGLLGRAGDSGGGILGSVIALFTSVVALLVPPVLANSIYFRRGQALIAQAKARHPDQASQVAFLTKEGGTSRVALAIILAILVIGGIVAAIALPAYQDYTIRAKVSEAFAAVAPLKVQIAESVSNTGNLPELDYEDTKGLPGSKFLKNVEMSPRGVLTMTFDIPSILNKKVQLVPRREGETIAWSCRNVDVPNRFLPPPCRDNR